MEHPLIGKLDDLTIDQLSEKINDLNNKLSFVTKTGNGHLAGQIRMALESYQVKYKEKLEKQSLNDEDNEDIGSNLLDIFKEFKKPHRPIHYVGMLYFIITGNYQNSVGI